MKRSVGTFFNGHFVYWHFEDVDWLQMCFLGLMLLETLRILGYKWIIVLRKHTSWLRLGYSSSA